jgi:hypothetical protein
VGGKVEKTPNTGQSLEASRHFLYFAKNPFQTLRTSLLSSLMASPSRPTAACHPREPTGHCLVDYPLRSACVILGEAWHAVLEGWVCVCSSWCLVAGMQVHLPSACLSVYHGECVRGARVMSVMITTEFRNPQGTPPPKITRHGTDFTELRPIRIAPGTITTWCRVTLEDVYLKRATLDQASASSGIQKSSLTTWLDLLPAGLKSDPAERSLDRHTLRLFPSPSGKNTPWEMPEMRQAVRRVLLQGQSLRLVQNITLIRELPNDGGCKHAPHTHNLLPPAHTTIAYYVNAVKANIEVGDSEEVISKKIADLQFRNPGRQPDFTDEEVIVLSHYMHQRDAIGTGLTQSQAASMLTKVKQRKAALSGKDALNVRSTRKAVRALMKRSALLADAERLFTYKAAALSTSRARARRPAVLNMFTGKYTELIEECRAKYGWTEIPPNRTWNIDEVRVRMGVDGEGRTTHTLSFQIGLDVEGRHEKVIGTRHARHERLRTGERAGRWVTALLACRADGAMTGCACGDWIRAIQALTISFSYSSSNGHSRGQGGSP